MNNAYKITLGAAALLFVIVLGYNVMPGDAESHEDQARSNGPVLASDEAAREAETPDGSGAEGLGLGSASDDTAASPGAGPGDSASSGASEGATDAEDHDGPGHATGGGAPSSPPPGMRGGDGDTAPGGTGSSGSSLADAGSAGDANDGGGFADRLRQRIDQANQQGAGDGDGDGGSTGPQSSENDTAAPANAAISSGANDRTGMSEPNASMNDTSTGDANPAPGSGHMAGGALTASDDDDTASSDDAGGDPARAANESESNGGSGPNAPALGEDKTLAADDAGPGDGLGGSALTGDPALATDQPDAADSATGDAGGPQNGAGGEGPNVDGTSPETTAGRSSGGTTDQGGETNTPDTATTNPDTAADETGTSAGDAAGEQGQTRTGEDAQTTPGRGQTPRTYTVKPGDSAWTIAQRFFGDGKHWRAIAQANPMTDPATIKPGDQLRLPDRSTVLADTESSGQDNDNDATNGQGEPQGNYTIQPGDTLVTIAREQYGDASQWRNIYRHNRRRIGPSPDRLEAGTRLQLPPAKAFENQ